MESIVNLRQHSQASSFFAEDKKYQRFEEFLAKNKIDPKRVPITELNFHVCGYGYFEKYKQNMKIKFRQYLWQSTHCCPELSSLKIIFNGFSVNNSQREQGEEEPTADQEHILINLFEAIEDIIRKTKLRVFHFHTTNLRKCTEKDLARLFSLINMLGNEEHCEEVSIQMTDWQFQGGYPDYQRLVAMLTEFVGGKPPNLMFKSFRLEMSSWYMKEKQGYKFLTKTLNTDQLIERFKKEQKSLPKPSSEPGAQDVVQEQENMANLHFPNLPAEQQDETLQALSFFLQNLDTRHLKPKYPHKKSSEQYDRQECKAHQFMLQQMSRTEALVSERLVKYPVQFVMGLRVEEFHNKMVAFLSSLLVKMNLLQEYHIDLRNWNGIFNMSGLKKNLDTKVISNKQQFSLIRKSLIQGNKQGKEGDDQGLKTVYTM